MKKLWTPLLFLLFTCSTQATHLIGGDMAYKKIGPTQIELTVTYYRDCLPQNEGGGNPQALLADAPTYLSIYFDDSTFIETRTLNNLSVQTAPNFGIPLCAGEAPNRCISELKFTEIIDLPNANTGYIFLNQRCCFSDNIVNTDQSGNKGQTLHLKIENLATQNFSADFRDDLGPVLCANYEQTIDLSATDPDNDSLSYELCDLVLGGSTVDPKPTLISFPALFNLNFSQYYSASNPIRVATPTHFNFDEQTGILTIQPNLQGDYLLGVCCTEWRNGVAIQKNYRYQAVRVAACGSAVKLKLSEDQTIAYNCPMSFWVEGADNYSWEILPKNQQLLALSDTSISNPWIVYLNNQQTKEGVFWLKVTGTNLNGCTAVDSTKLIVTDGSKFFIPTAFSPNGDGRNDFLTIFSSGHDLEFMRIYNRWGNQVFESNSLDNKWDGTFNGKEAAAETYFWVARYRDKARNRITKKGTVTIVR